MCRYFRHTGTFFILMLGCFIGLATNVSRAQHLWANPFFNRITTAEGLSGNIITAFCRDQRGFLWIGTKNGLNLYDGNSIRVFRHNRFQPNSIVSDDINSIVEDDSGFLWLGTNNGIARFDPITGQSLNFQHQTANPHSLSDNYNCRVYCDQAGKIWVGNEFGLSYLDLSTRQFKAVKILPDSLKKKPLSEVTYFLEDKQGRFWIGTHSGLVLYNRKNGTSRLYQLNPDKKKGANLVTALFQDHKGRIWLGFWGYGMVLFNPENGRFISYRWNENSKFKSAVNIIFSFTENRDAAGHYLLWAATSEGLLRLKNDDTFTNGQSIARKANMILPNLEDPHSLSIKGISCLLTDKQHIMWIGTLKGVNEYISQNQLFSERKPLKGTITRIWVDTGQGKLKYYVATWFGEGLIELDHNLEVVHVWEKIPAEATNVDNSQISDVIRAQNGTLWVGTFNGLYFLPPFEKKFRTFPNNMLSGKQITALAEDPSGKIWIGTYRGGINLYDPIKKTVVQFRDNGINGNTILGNRVDLIYIDKQDQVWVATDRGLNFFRNTTHNFIQKMSEINDVNSLAGVTITGITEDSREIYWISTDLGLARVDFRSGKLRWFRYEDGLFNNYINSMVQDNAGILWLGAGNGISSFNPVTRTFINYDEQNGLPFGTATAMAKSPWGAILVGMGNQVIRINPEGFISSQAPPTVYITGISVSGIPWRMQRPYRENQSVILHYPDNNFSATFSAPEFINGKAVKYSFRLEGVDKSWIDAGTQNFVTYSGLTPGEYVLHVKAANSDGIWSQKEVKLKITVLPPFWKTWWFRFALLVLIACLVYLLFSFRVRRIRKQEAMKTEINRQMADMRLQVLRSRMNPHFMFNALNSIQECIYTGKTQAAYRYLSKFSRLIRMVLERSGQDYITIGQAIELLELYLQLEALRFEDGFSYEIKQQEEEIGFLKIPPMLVQPFVENAIWHGLLHKTGEKKLLISFEADETNVYVRIQDNGIGRDDAGIQNTKDIIRQVNDSIGKEKNSMGIKLVDEQLTALWKKTNREARVDIEDLQEKDKDGNKISTGTSVTLTLPHITE